MTRDPSTPPDLPGYSFVRALGRGGFSDVFLYEQLLPHREVAVKVLRADLGPEGMAAFRREANLMARVSAHPYIVTIHDAGVAADRRPYLVLEYCSRPTLAEAYKRRPLAVDEALRTGIRLASAVETAHRAGILHRDIKPGNVLTNEYGRPVLTDFGIAAAADRGPVGRGDDGSDAEASTGHSMGLSVPWSPPELFLDVPEHDVRSDVFSLAATLHTVLAGRTPFEVPGGSNTVADLMARIDRGQLAPLQRDDVPRSLVAVLERGMATRREDRWPSALELGRALQRVELGLGLAPTPLEVAESPRAEPIAVDRDAAETRVRAVPVVDPGLPSPTPRTRLVGILVGVFSLLVASGVALAIVLTGDVELRGTPPAPGATGGSAIDADRIHPVVNGEGVPGVDGTTVEFTWTNPDPREGDTYYWARSETPRERSAVHEPRVVVDGVVPGSRICVNIEIGRSGRTSEPVAICTR